MIYKLRKLLKGERGITGLETAIILVAFVVVAAVFSFAVLSAGTFATQKSEEAVYAGLSQVRSTIHLKGAVIAKDTDNNDYVDEIVFTISNVAGGAPVDLTVPPTNTLVIDYVDEAQRYTDLEDWEVAWMGSNDADDLLEEGETAEITVSNLEGILDTDLGADTEFALEVKPQKGATLVIERRTPHNIDKVMILHE